MWNKSSKYLSKMSNCYFILCPFVFVLITKLNYIYIYRFAMVIYELGTRREIEKVKSHWNKSVSIYIDYNIIITFFINILYMYIFRVTNFKFNAAKILHFSQNIYIQQKYFFIKSFQEITLRESIFDTILVYIVIIEKSKQYIDKDNSQYKIYKYEKIF